MCNEGGIDNVGALFGFGAVMVPSGAVSLPSEVNSTIECEPRATIWEGNSLDPNPKYSDPKLNNR